MAKRQRDVCGLPEDETLWKIGRGFVVRDLPWTEKMPRGVKQRNEVRVRFLQPVEADAP